MPTAQIKKQIYRWARIKIGLNQKEWGRIFSLGNTKNVDQVVYQKENEEQPGPGSTSRGVNMPEALSAQLLAFLHDQGYDIKAIIFDEEGRMAPIPKRKKARTKKAG